MRKASKRNFQLVLREDEDEKEGRLWKEGVTRSFCDAVLWQGVFAALFVRLCGAAVIAPGVFDRSHVLYEEETGFLVVELGCLLRVFAAVASTIPVRHSSPPFPHNTLISISITSLPKREEQHSPLHPLPKEAPISPTKRFSFPTIVFFTGKARAGWNHRPMYHWLLAII